MDRRSFLLAAAAFPPLAVVIAACGDRTIDSGGTTTPSTTVPASSSVAYPTGPDDVVVRVASVGGFVPAGTAFVEVPTLLITGDGRLFRPGVQTMEFPGPLLPAITLGSITPTGIERLLSVAQTEGLLTAPVPEYAPNTQVADAPSTVVDLAANGAQFHHQADALGFVPDAQGDPDNELTPERQHLLRFVNAATDLPAMVGASELGPDDVWTPSAYRIQARPADPSTITEEPEPTIVPWPADTGIRLADATTCAIGTGEVLASTLAAANTLTFFTEDGVTYQLSAVGQLPGTGCS